jgi:RNA recognition motif-containing protein
MVKTLFVGSLPWSTTDEELKAKFEEHVPVVAARIVSDRQSGRSKGFGFVEVDDADMEKAISAMNGQKMGEREIVVNEARPKTDRPKRSGGGGGFGSRF